MVYVTDVFITDSFAPFMSFLEKLWFEAFRGMFTLELMRATQPHVLCVNKDENK